MSYIIQATLCNAQYPENGSNEILFPLEQKDYADEIQRLGELGAGDAVKQDCMVEKIDSGYEVLGCLKGQVVNVDELDYLAKRLDSFDVYEAAQFQAACAFFDLKDIKDFVNMTFCCQEGTVISDFSRLEEAGKQHYLTIHGGSALAAEVDAVNGKALAQQLIQSGEGKPTPYGLFFRNEMRMKELYQGYGFPPYLWDTAQAEVTLTTPSGGTAYVFLPITELALERFQQREHIENLTECKHSLRLLKGQSGSFSLERGMAELDEWNELCDTLNVMSEYHQQVFAAALEVIGAEDLAQLQLLASNLADFEFIPCVKDAESYGRYIIQDSCRYRYDPDLECYYNYEALGEFHMTHEAGQITSQGYLKCEEGSAFLDFFTQDSMEPVQGQVEQTMQMGGM